MNKNRRALIVVTDLTTIGIPKYKQLYQFIDASGASLADMLALNYGTYHRLVGVKATKALFLNAIQQACNKRGVTKVDVILNLHGSPHTLHFHDGAVSTTDLATEINALTNNEKLRLLYSTACFGDTHAADLLSAGFNTTVGAISVNANAAAEYPTVLTMWGAGQKIRDAIAAGENILTRAPADAAAAALGFSQVNSDKNIHGNRQLTINS